MPTTIEPPGMFSLRGRSRMVFVGFVVVAALLYLISEHRSHTLTWLPVLLVLACPAMHLFMHRGHGGHGGSHEQHRPGDGAGRGGV